MSLCKSVVHLHLEEKCVCVVSIEFLTLMFPFFQAYSYLVSGVCSMVATTCTHKCVNSHTHYVHRQLKSPILAYNNPSLSLSYFSNTRVENSFHSAHSDGH